MIVHEYTCIHCGKTRKANYPGKKVCLACNIQKKKEDKPITPLGLAFEICGVIRTLWRGRRKIKY